MGVAEIEERFGSYAAVRLTAERPFGRLVDRVGRKPVFLRATVESRVAAAVFISSGTFWPLAASFGLVDLGRAVRSKTLDAWYVEGRLKHAPGAEIRPLLARAQTANFVVPGTIRDFARLAMSKRARVLSLAILGPMLVATNPVEMLWPTVVPAMPDPERVAAIVGLLTTRYFLAIAIHQKMSRARDTH